MEWIYKEYCILGNEIPFAVVCGSVVIMVFLCFIMAMMELKKK